MLIQALAIECWTPIYVRSQQMFSRYCHKAAMLLIIIDPRTIIGRGMAYDARHFWIRGSGIYRLTLFLCGPQSRDDKLIWRVDLVSCLIACSLFQSRDTFNEQDVRSRTKPRQIPGDLQSSKNEEKCPTTVQSQHLRSHLIAVGLNGYPCNVHWLCRQKF